MAEGRDTTYDLIVIGAGGAGSTAAFEAVARGAKVAMIERWKVGGTCLNVGCDPTKTLVRSAEVLHLARQADRHGIEIDAVRPDWPAVLRRVEAVIDTIRGGDGERNIRHAGIDLRMATARFIDPHTIAVDGTLLRADKVIVATGATPRLPPIPGLAAVGYLTNVEAVALPALPRSLAIIGAGVVGVEFAQIFARFGVEVTLIGSRPHILPREEPELTEALRAILEREGVRVETDLPLTNVSLDGPRKRLTGLRNGEPVEVAADEILLAAGRRPAVRDLGLADAGIDYSGHGIVVDDELRTTAPNVWAVGDVTGIEPFTHVADYQARIAEHNALSGGAPKRADYRVVPRAVFTDPELARVGLTEAAAVASGHAVRCATVKIGDLARGLTSGETEGLVKLVADRASGEILGGHVLAARGGELLPEIALAMRMRLRATAIAETIHAYPTMAEGVFWAAFELAKPDDPALDAVRGVSAPALPIDPDDTAGA